VPLIQLLLFGYAINPDPKQLPAALVATSQDHYSRAVISALETTGYYRFDHVALSAAEAEALITAGKVAFVVTIPADLARRIDRGEKPRILIEADASDPSAASGAIGTLGTVMNRAVLREQGIAQEAEQERESRLDVVVHRRYNPEGVAQYNIVPGLLGVILQMTMVMMTSIALTREIERGTMENLLAMPSSPFEIMLGKVLPGLAVGAAPVRHPLRRRPVRASRRHPRLRAGAGASGLSDLDHGAHPDAGAAAHLLLLPAVDHAVGLHVPVSRHA
jgi:ABC-2 type transport system permease protein